MQWIGDYDLDECPFCWKRGREVCHGSFPLEDYNGLEHGTTYAYSCSACKGRWVIHDPTFDLGYFRERVFSSTFREQS